MFSLNMVLVHAMDGTRKKERIFWFCLDGSVATLLLIVCILCSLRLMDASEVQTCDSSCQRHFGISAEMSGYSYPKTLWHEPIFAQVCRHLGCSAAEVVRLWPPVDTWQVKHIRPKGYIRHMLEFNFTIKLLMLKCCTWLVCTKLNTGGSAYFRFLQSNYCALFPV